MNRWRERLRIAVERSGRKHCAIAWSAGVTPETLSRILTGRQVQPRFETVVRIAHATGESVAWLVDEPSAPMAAHEWKELRETLKAACALVEKR